MRKKMRRTEMYLTNNQYNIIKKEADKKEINFSEMIRKILDNYIEEKKCQNL